MARPTDCACAASRASTVTCAPLRTSASAAARAAPPAPSTTAATPRSAIRFFSGATTPRPSVVEPCRRPSRTSTVLTLPLRAAVSSTSCRWDRISTLYGRVTLKPQSPSAGSACRKGGSASAARGTYTASMPHSANARLWIAGERLRATSEPSTPYTRVPGPTQRTR
jgi:hypothetical protein